MSIKRTAIKRDDGMTEIDCGCLYLVACDEHRYITCGGCGGRAEVTPIGVLCPRCTFGHD